MLAPRRHGSALISLTALLVAAGATSASAHGIGPAADKSAPEFLWLGTEHMLLGWDHLLFVAAVLLLAGSARRAAALISLFALGHSTTLLIATLAGWRVNPVAVDVIVALSLVFAGVVGLLGAGERRWFAPAVACFGLVHGLGLATRLQDLDLPDDGKVARVLAFNVGVEIGQMAAIAVFVALAAGARRLPPQLRPEGRGIRVAQAALVACGVAAAATLVVLGDTSGTAQAQGSCQVRDRTESFTGDSGHPKDFTEPGEPAPESGFGNVIGDGYVIVQYRPQLPAADMDALRDHVTDPKSGRVVGGPAPDQKPVLKAVHAYLTLTCTEFDLEALREFTGAWRADPRMRQVG
ncbi:HupE/UreJ family protein [Streptomyces sp. AC555_RSS877]|uniref:HupE/UreJ family protein n=1 Tax=Streptomyces sp. AC555_RSS877 TaxID=2823688 RepID=UPI001C259663|nr:HupE/UreJ family protein [Streptomyces sp. AC555_RSS877]